MIPRIMSGPMQHIRIVLRPHVMHEQQLESKKTIRSLIAIVSSGEWSKSHVLAQHLQVLERQSQRHEHILKLVVFELI